jgi:hypothetical protein
LDHVRGHGRRHGAVVGRLTATAGHVAAHQLLLVLLVLPQHLKKKNIFLLMFVQVEKMSFIFRPVGFFLLTRQIFYAIRYF